MKNFFNNFLKYKEKNNYKFILPNTANNINISNFKNSDHKKVSADLKENLKYLKVKFNTLINSDIKTREFEVQINSRKYSACIFFIDGMVCNNDINEFILKPLLLKNSITMNSNTRNQILAKNNSISDVQKYLHSCLFPENSITLEDDFFNIVPKINSGFCALFIESLPIAFCLEVKGVKTRGIEEPTTESVIKGPHEGFIENLRTNTSLLRKIINNEKLIIEEMEVGKISKTKVAICYLKDITNEDLVAETKYRINNLDIDYLISSGQLEQFISDNFSYTLPQTISTERPDKAANFIFLGRIAILVNGSPFAIIVPSVLLDFLSSAEDFNLNYIYANFLKVVRLIALISALLVPGLYVAITMYHYELVPSELLFAIIAARKAIPFPIIFEILIMEICFELIQEASIRAPASFSTTVGIIGALILGDAAVSANIVSPILIIIVAYSGICAFAIPDNGLRFSMRLFRFMYLILGYIAGFLGIGLGFFVQFLLLSSQSSFGVPFFAPYIPFSDLKKNESLFVEPVWKRENRNTYLNTKKPKIENHISMKWRENGKQL